MADGQIAIAERWYSATELAGLPGLPGTERNVRATADREGWTSRPRPGRGGGREYPISVLPEITRRELRRRAAISAASKPERAAGEVIGRKLALTSSIDAAVQQRTREAGTARAAGLTGTAKDRMNAKLDLLGRFDQFAQHHATGKCAAMEAFVVAYRNGDIYFPMRSRALIGCDVSPATLRRWQRQVASQGLASLAGDYGNRAGSGIIDSQPALRDFVLGLLADKPHITAKNMHRVLEAKFSGTGVVIPHVRSCARWLVHIKRDHAQMYTALANPDAWKSRFMPAFGCASEDIVRLNQRWEFDSSPADVLLVDGRYTIIQAVDVWSRRRVFYVAKTSSASAVCETLRRAVLAWGIPEEIKIDNGKDYVSERVERSFKGLGADPLVSPPFQPWKKPHVERGFRTFFHGLFELLPGFAGHNVAEAQGLRSSQSFAERMFTKDAVVEMRISADELQTFCDRWLAIYEREELEGENWPRGMSVAERVASWTGEVRRITSERALDVLLAEAPTGNSGRSVTKKGLRVEGHTYIAPELAELVGERVQVYYDERNIGRVIVYHNEQFACVAECPEIAGVSRMEIAIAATAITKQRVAEQRTAMRKLKSKISKVDLVETVLAFREAQAASLALPQAQNVIDATPQFEEAQRAVEALDDAVIAETKHVGEVRDEFMKVLGAARAAGRVQRGDEEEAEQRFVLALDVLLKDPAERTEFDNRRISGYCQSPEFRGRWDMLQSFGASAFLTLDDKYNCFHEEGALAHRLRELDRLIAEQSR